MNRFFLLLGLAGLLAAAGCRKDDIIDCAPTPTPTSNLSLEDFTRRNGVPVQVFSLTLGSTAQVVQTITTSSGAKISFPSVGFLLPNGSPAVGMAQVRVREIYSVPDMLLSNMPTQVLNTRRLLISGGEFSIQVWQNGVRLRLAAAASRLTVVSAVPAGAGAGTQLVWQQLTAIVRDSAAWSQPATLDSVRLSASTYTMPIPLDSVSWWNIDRLWQLYQTNTLGTVTVQTPTIPATSNGSTYVFIRPVGLNGLLRIYRYATTAASDRWPTRLPVGASMVVAVLQSVNGQLYFGSQPITTSAGLVVTPPLTAVSEADAVRLIKQL